MTVLPGSNNGDATNLSPQRHKKVDVDVQRRHLGPQGSPGFDTASQSPDLRPITLYHFVPFEPQTGAVDWKSKSSRHLPLRETPFTDETGFEMMYFCSQCTTVSRRFKHKYNLRRHLRRSHNIICLSDDTELFYSFRTKVPKPYQGQKPSRPSLFSSFQPLDDLGQRDFEYAKRQKSAESPELHSDGDLQVEEQGGKSSILSPLSSSEHEGDDLPDSQRVSTPAAPPVTLYPEQGREVRKTSGSAPTDAEPDYQDEYISSQQSTTGPYNPVETLPIPQSIRRRFLAHLLFEFWRSNYAPTAHGAADGRNTSRQTPAVPIRTSSYTGSLLSKRKYASTSANSDGGDEEEEGERPGPARLPRTESSQGEITLLLACPYYKRKPLEHVQCQQYTLRTINRVKQHIWRNHCIPIHCSSCNMTFKTEPERDVHLRQRPPCELQTPIEWDGINKEQEEVLRRRSDPRKSTQEQWNDVFEILFPGSPPPSSPYLDPIKSHQLVKLQTFMGREWPSIFERLVAEYIPAELRSQQNVLQPFMSSLFQNAISIVLQRFESSTEAGDMASTSDSGYHGNRQEEQVAVDESEPVEGDVNDSLLGVGHGRDIGNVDVTTPDVLGQVPELTVDNLDEFLEMLNESGTMTLL